MCRDGNQEMEPLLINADQMRSKDLNDALVLYEQVYKLGEI